MWLAAGGRVESEGVLEVGRVGVPRDTGAPGIFLGGLGGDLPKRLGLVRCERSVRVRPVMTFGGRCFVDLEVNGVWEREAVSEERFGVRSGAARTGTKVRQNPCDGRKAGGARGPQRQGTGPRRGAQSRGQAR